MPGDAREAHPDMDLNALMDICVDGHGIARVTQSGSAVGVINRPMLMRAIQNNRG